MYSRYDKPDVVDYVNWHSQEALDNVTGDCVQLLLSEDGKWRLSNCSENAYFVCMKNQRKSVSLMQGTRVECWPDMGHEEGRLLVGMKSHPHIGWTI